MDFQTSRTHKFSDYTKAIPVTPVVAECVEQVEVVYPNTKKRLEESKMEIEKLCKTKRWLWNKFSRGMNPYELPPTLIKEKKISRAYYKMWEILIEFSLLEGYIDKTKKINFLHLCEGPGGFIQACREYREKIHRDEESINSDSHVGITLKPDPQHGDVSNLPDFSEEVPEISNCIITYGKDGTGNLYNTKNIKNLSCNLEQATGCCKANIITADGGFDVSENFNNQEALSMRLFISQVLTALETQEVGGHFVMKIFDTHTRAMIDLLYILQLNYEFMYIYKPAMSRPCNSEYYVICKVFKGKAVKSHISKLYSILNKLGENDSLKISSLLKNPPPQGFINEICFYISDTINNQISNINIVIQTINQGKAISNSKLERYKQTQNENAKKYCEMYRLLW
tara:strand:+ start:116 stop:1309 length:1194 start_codon:yes stop_codon:yes gene_type:complete